MTPSLDHLIDQHTTTDDAELAADSDYATWCDDHRDAWIAETAAEVTP